MRAADTPSLGLARSPAARLLQRMPRGLRRSNGFPATWITGCSGFKITIAPIPWMSRAFALRAGTPGTTDWPPHAARVICAKAQAMARTKIAGICAVVPPRTPGPSVKRYSLFEQLHRTLHSGCGPRRYTVDDILPEAVPGTDRYNHTMMACQSRSEKSRRRSLDDMRKLSETIKKSRNQRPQ